MAKELDVLSVVAPNGLGHFRRQVGILSRLLETSADVRVHVFCAEFQITRTRDWPRSMAFFSDSRVSFTTGIVDPGVTWSSHPEYYDDAAIINWKERLAPRQELQSAKLVISDNLPQVLEYRPDAMLCGSFLWGDLLATAHAGHPVVAEFRDAENELLERTRPPMICVGDMAMPAVLERTRALPVGWMCEGDSATIAIPHGGRPAQVALLGGATGSADLMLREIADKLGRDRRDVVLSTSVIHTSGGVRPFRHQPEDFAGLTVCICRPGMGTVTDCVAHCVPMLTLHDGPTNPELAHNGRRIAELGLGVDLGADPSPGSVVAALDAMLDESTQEKTRGKLAALRKDGLTAAVEVVNELIRK